MVKGKHINREPGLCIVELSGRPREIGEAHGRLLGAEIALMKTRLLKYLSDISFGIGGRALMWYIGHLAGKMEAFIPEGLREEMHGVAEGSGQSYRFILLMNVLDDVLVNLGCSSLAIERGLSEDGRLVVGRNLDYPLFYDILPRLNTVFKISPDKGRPFVSVAWPGFSAVVTGMNDAGIFIADLTSLSRDKTTKGFPALLLNRTMLQHSDSVDDIASTLGRTRRTVGKNLMAASPFGARVFEISATKMAVREAHGGFLACTNHFEDPDMAPLQGGIRTPPKTGLPESYYSYAFSKERLDKIRPLSSRGKIGVAEVVSILGAEPVANVTTVQSVVFVPETRRILVARRESTPVSLGEYRDLTGLLN
jgi:hypothetical protein